VPLRWREGEKNEGQRRKGREDWEGIRKGKQGRDGERGQKGKIEGEGPHQEFLGEVAD